MRFIHAALILLTAPAESFVIFGLDFNLNWLRQTNMGHVDSRENKRPEQRIEPLANTFELLNSVMTFASPCEGCKASLSVIKERLNQEDGDSLGFVSSLFYGICNSDHSYQPMLGHLCESLHLYQSTTASDGFSFLPDFANTVREMDTEGLDGEYLCHYMFSNACSRPITEVVDYSQYLPPRQQSSRPSKASERSNETIKVLHVSDVHLSSNYTELSPANCLGAMCCDKYAVQNTMDDWLPAPKYGHWRCDAPQALLDSALADTNNRSQHDFSFALFTGDMVDHNPVLISQEDTFLEESRTLKSLKEHLGDIPVYPVLGNHDSYPYSQEPPKDSKYASRTEMNLELMEHLWSDYNWVDDNQLKQIETTHGAYSVEPIPGLKVITLNSNYWYRWNFYNYVDMIDPDRSEIVRFLIKELADCDKRGLKAWVQAHVPPGGLADEALPPAASLFTASLEHYSDIITGMFFGHTHLDEFSVLYGNNATSKLEDNALNVAWIAPSITPYTDLNPGWRYYEADTGSFEIMDSVTIMADIEPGFGVPWPDTPELEWKVLYSAREEYGKTVAWPESEPLNGKFWHRVASEILYNSKFAAEFVHRSYRESTPAPDCSDYSCRAERYCYATSMSPDQVYDCHEKLHAGMRLKPAKHMFNKQGLRSRLSYVGMPTFPMPRPDRTLFGLFTNE